jgi:hypothetical protein
MYLEKYLLDAKCSEQSYSPLEGDLEERRGRHPPRSGDHQFRLLKGAQFLPVDGDRNIARLEYVLRDAIGPSLDSRTSGTIAFRRSTEASREGASVVMRPSALLATQTSASRSWNALNDRCSRPSLMLRYSQAAGSHPIGSGGALHP